MQPGISEEWFLMGGLKQAGEPPGILSEQLLSGENKVVKGCITRISLQEGFFGQEHRCHKVPASRLG